MKYEDLFSVCFLIKDIAVAFNANIMFIYLNIMYLFIYLGKFETNKDQCIKCSVFHEKNHILMK